MKVVAVIPAWNEASRIREAISGVKSMVDEVVVVDDGSPDDTTIEATAAGAIVLRHTLNRGQGAALKTGTIAALSRGADIIVHVDADGQHDPAMIPLLVEPIREGRADVVFGSRFLGTHPTGMPRVRRLYFIAARLFNTFALGIPRSVTDPQNGARAFSRMAAERINFHQDGFAHCSEILRMVTRPAPPVPSLAGSTAGSDLRWMEVPVHVRYTSAHLRKGVKFTEAFRIVWHLIVRGIAK